MKGEEINSHFIVQHLDANNNWMTPLYIKAGELSERENHFSKAFDAVIYTCEYKNSRVVEIREIVVATF